jgi:hypothetical protein
MSFSFPSILVLVFGFVLLMNLTRHGRRWRWEQRSAGALSSAELAEIERRLAAVEQLEARVLELENRLDFTERLLTQQASHRTSD